MNYGYHYTSWSNWLSIQKEGLKRYQINKPELQELFPGEAIKGIWTWDKRPTGKSEVGCVIFQVSTKMETRVVLLRFPYFTYLQKNGQRVVLNHDGVIGSWYYHEKDPAIIVTHDILPEEVELVREFDIMDITTEGGDKMSENRQ